MQNKKQHPRLLLLLLFILVVGLLRILNAVEATPWSHFTPLGAMALFGGAYFDKRWKAFLFPLLTLFIGDLVIHSLIYEGKYQGRPVIYLCFLLIVIIGIFVIKKVSVKTVALSSVLSTLTLWLIADFAVWLGGGRDIRTGLPLSRGVDGLMQSYVQGFPFAVNFLLGTLFYAAVMFGLYEWMVNRFPAFKKSGWTIE